MSSTWQGFEELQPLCEAAIEERLTPEQLQRLEQLVLEHPEARRLYVEYLHQHASLRWSVAEPALLAMPRPVPPEPAARTVPIRGHARTFWKRLGIAATGVAAAAVLALAIGLGVYSARLRQASDRPPAPFARLAEGKACKWDGGTLPTEVGAPLGQGRLRLAEGLARIVFDHGAEVTLEAPADLELVSSQRCLLHGGRLVGKVPPRAVGFMVETPTAELKDLGTEFAINVRDAATSDVQVFTGLVDVRHRSSGRTEHMQTGQNLRFGTDAVGDFDPLAEVPETYVEPAPPDGRATGRVMHISTATGRGKDAYIQPKYPSEHHSDILLLVKYSASRNPDYERKAYIGLDLAPMAGMTVVDARLSLTFAPTGMGYASEVPDASFAVYGLTDERLDDWDEERIRWQNAPANQPGGASLDQTKVVRLGTFEIVQGELSGTRSIEGPALCDFLNHDTNGLATFIVVRETQGSGRSDLVHGFANKNHPELPPPTLRLSVAPRK
jgi:ferric-dicitrate binding protein FerR (iron transport regulator)